MSVPAGINFCAMHIPYINPYAKDHLNYYILKRPVTFNHYFPQPSLHLYYIKNQQDATLAVLFISNCKITLHVSDAFCVHHQEY